jgi:hypothetical protein
VDDFKFTPNVREKSTFCVGVFQKPGQEKANQHMHKIVSLISNLKKAVIYSKIENLNLPPGRKLGQDSLIQLNGIVCMAWFSYSI